ncbi:MAG: hypothetical protein WBY47_00880, partial [Desulfobacterales bacterium]
RDAVRHFKKSILNSQGKILGCIINKVDVSRRFGYQPYYRYYSHYQYYGELEGAVKKDKQKPPRITQQ